MNHDQLLKDRFIPWALNRDDVRGLAELGSRVGQAPPDEWADMDLLLLVRDTGPFLDSDDWLAEISPHWLALRHPGPFPDLPVRQVLFADALDFDIVPMAAGTVAVRMEDPGVAFALGGGFRGGLRVSIDKDDEFASLQLPDMPDAPNGVIIGPAEFDFVVNDFLFQVVWATKHLRRGEVFAAKDDVDGYMKARLIQVIEWHANCLRPDARTRSGGRYLEEWADPRIIDGIGATFAAYTPQSVAKALLAMADLFQWVATETADALAFEYPKAAHRQVIEWSERCLEPLA